METKPKPPGAVTVIACALIVVAGLKVFSNVMWLRKWPQLLETARSTLGHWLGDLQRAGFATGGFEFYLALELAIGVFVLIAAIQFL